MTSSQQDGAPWGLRRHCTDWAPCQHPTLSSTLNLALASLHSKCQSRTPIPQSCRYRKSRVVEQAKRLHVVPDQEKCWSTWRRCSGSMHIPLRSTLLLGILRMLRTRSVTWTVFVIRWRPESHSGLKIITLLHGLDLFEIRQCDGHDRG